MGEEDKSRIAPVGGGYTTSPPVGEGRRQWDIVSAGRWTAIAMAWVGGVSHTAYVSRARRIATSAMPTFAVQFGHASTSPESTAKTRTNFSETGLLQWSHESMACLLWFGHLARSRVNGGTPPKKRFSEFSPKFVQHLAHICRLTPPLSVPVATARPGHRAVRRPRRPGDTRVRTGGHRPIRRGGRDAPRPRRARGGCGCHRGPRRGRH